MLLQKYIAVEQVSLILSQVHRLECNIVRLFPKGMVDATIDRILLQTFTFFLFTFSGIYVMTLTWVPTADQYGPQSFCASAIDDNNLQSDGWCITYLVGFESPELIRITAVQGSASPVGTIFSNHSIFSIQGK